MRVLITGGCGFIGSNLVRDLSQAGFDVVLFDNLSRPRTAHNLDWLQSNYKIEFVKGSEFQLKPEDIKDLKKIKSTYRKLAKKYHPDKNKGDRSVEEKFKEVHYAYKMLTDPSFREKNLQRSDGELKNQLNVIVNTEFSFEQVFFGFGDVFISLCPRRRQGKGLY